jgi:hypothetical protein
MELTLLASILNPGVLFFILGFIARMINSDLSIPEPIIKFVTLYLMLSIGFKGGVGLFSSSLYGDGMLLIGLVLLMSWIVPLYSFHFMKRWVAIPDAAAIAATYGSNSTLTYITAAGFLTSMGVYFGGYMTVALVLMETPAIIYSVYLARKYMNQGGVSGWNMFTNSLRDGTLVLLLGSLFIGYILSILHVENTPLTAFIGGDMFTGMLVFFLMYMGLNVGDRVKELWNSDDRFPPILVIFAIIAPIINGLLSVGISVLFGFNPGDAFLFTMLVASASYIVAPAILKYALPEANPAIFLTMSMAITFPLNIILGIPGYWWLINILL